MRRLQFHTLLRLTTNTHCLTFRTAVNCHKYKTVLTTLLARMEKRLSVNLLLVLSLFSMKSQAAITVTTDDDRDGFDDTTELPTHYFQCYSEWTEVGTLKNNCELGGPYVIPIYAHHYDD